MHGNSVDLLFPSRAIEFLSKARGDGWESLINKLAGLEPTNPDRIAFVLMMVRIGGCASCQSDSFRAMRGCILCSSTTVKRYKGNDQTLIDMYNEAKVDLNRYMEEVKKYDG
jgi:hypothetical protein